MLDWIFEGIVTWISSVMTSLMDAVSGLFLDALGTDMVVMEEYFPFVTKAFGILQYTAWALLFLITAWQLFRAFGGPRSAGSVFRGSGAAGSSATSTAAGVASGFANRFKGNSYVRDAVVNGGTRMGAGGSIGFVGRAFGGIAARNGATLSGESISSVASRPSAVSGSIGGEIADRSLKNYMPQLGNRQLKNTQISGGRISTTSVGTDGKQTSVEMFNASQFEKPAGPHAMLTASDGSQWYQVASGPDDASFYDAPHFSGSSDEMRRWPPSSRMPPTEPFFAVSEKARFRLRPRTGQAPCGITAPCLKSQTLPIPLWVLPTVRIGTPCSPIVKRPVLNPGLWTHLSLEQHLRGLQNPVLARLLLSHPLLWTTRAWIPPLPCLRHPILILTCQIRQALRRSCHWSLLLRYLMQLSAVLPNR